MIKKVKYIAWLFMEIASSSIMVTKIIWGLLPSKPQVKSVKISLDSDVEKVVMANSITLTPGTISILLEEDEILVHAVAPDLFVLREMELRVRAAFN